MTTNRLNITALTGLEADTDLDIGGMLKDYLRDCRLGHCNHPVCRRKADRRFAQSMRAEAVEVDETPAVIDEGMLELFYEAQRECRAGVCNHPECHRKARRAARQESHQEEPVLGEFPAVIPMTADGRIDKQALREARIFG